MKKRLAAVLLLALCVVFSATANAAETAGAPRIATATNNTIAVSNSTQEPDAHLVHPAVYKIDGFNYFRLRDLAMILNGSEKQFAVDYDPVSKNVLITTGKPYVPAGDELTGAAREKSSAVYSDNAVLIDGESVMLTAFKIDGYNYFRLQDLGRALDFHVGYSDETKTVFLSGAKGYEGD
ncbi:MAG: hypothetical protein J6P31_01660 [Oscillospiraceae bacterium]|nr:hypothetical protein [Oscillospiraceae bacterium]